jgi:dolichol-phosphate mannosyltransferase
MQQRKTSTKPVLSVVVPLFNEEAIISDLVKNLQSVCSSCVKDYELIMVNDGSNDETLQMLAVESETRPELVIVDLSRNYGHMQALSAGLNFASGRAIVVMDGDFQDPPELIPELVGEWKNGADIVLAKRTKRNENFLQRLLTKWFYIIFKALAEISIPNQVGTFCLMDRRVVQKINQMPERQRYFAGLRSWVGYKTSTVDYQRPARKNGKSRVSFRGLISLARLSIISFSKWPLTFVSRISFIASIILFIFGIAVIGIKIFTQLAIPGWASIMVLVGGIASLQSAVMAILCEYIAVLFDEIKQRPNFLINQVIRKDESTYESLKDSTVYRSSNHPNTVIDFEPPPTNSRMI